MNHVFRVAMITDKDGYVRAKALPLEIMWRNPLCLVMAKLRLREASNLYYGWQSKPEKVAHVERIRKLIIAGQREYCGSQPQSWHTHHLPTS
jgi:hypothetical protein